MRFILLKKYSWESNNQIIKKFEVAQSIKSLVIGKGVIYGAENIHNLQIQINIDFIQCNCDFCSFGIAKECFQ